MWTPPTRASLPLAAPLLLTAGLGTVATAETTRPFSEIQASPIAITPDPSGRAAILEVDTAIDVACSVIYGTDETFGLIAVDNDMDGGAHADHSPILGGLQPGTDYVYRLQGTAPDGAIYVSEVMTFSTPVAVSGPTNLALDATVTGASSEFSDAFADEHAFDGDIATEWYSKGDGSDAWVEIDLVSPQPIGDIEFRTRSMSDGTARTESYRVTADGVEYGPFPADARVTELADQGVEAQVLRFDVETSTGGNTGAIDIVVLEREDL